MNVESIKFTWNASPGAPALPSGGDLSSAAGEESTKSGKREGLRKSSLPFGSAGTWPLEGDVLIRKHMEQLQGPDLERVARFKQ